MFIIILQVSNFMASNSQSDQLLCIKEYCRAAGGVDTSVSKEIMRLGT